MKTKGAFQKNTYGLMKKTGFKNVCTLLLQLCKARAYLKKYWKQKVKKQKRLQS